MFSSYVRSEEIPKPKITLYRDGRSKTERALKAGTTSFLAALSLVIFPAY